MVKAARRKKRERKAKLATLPALKRKAWKLLSEYVRRKSASPTNGMAECYTCGTMMHWSRLQGGHFVPGRTGSVLLVEENVRPQCRDCNIFHRGSYHAYTLKMLSEIGRAKVDELMALRHQTKKWSRAELDDFIDEYKMKIADLGPII
jgi:hypothetical protein